MNFRSNVQYCIASATWAGERVASPSKSVMVGAILRFQTQALISSYHTIFWDCSKMSLALGPQVKTRSNADRLARKSPQSCG